MAEESQIRYFEPGEMVITFEHRIPPEDSNFVGRLKEHSLLQGERGYRNLLQESPGISEYISTDRIGELERTSGLRAALDRLTPESIQTIKTENREIPYLSFAFLSSTSDEVLYDDLTLAYLTSELSYQRARFDNGNSELQVVSVMPNWFFSSTPASLTDGGPGARPVPPLPIQLGQPVPHDDYDYGPRPLPAAPRKLTPAKVTLEEAFSTEGKNNTTVFILDALPPIGHLRRAFNSWGRNSFNTLIERMLAPHAHTRQPLYFETARLKLHYYDTTLDKLFHDPGRRTKDHNYWMADHGLFIAGIIDCLAPQTDICMIEVLNRRGVGTFQSLSWGLQQVLNIMGTLSTEHFLVNCSLMMTLPHDPKLPMAANHPVINFYNVVTPFINPTETIRLLFDDIITQSGGAIIVAAAGNDSELPNFQIAARFPAAFTNVIGVGALTKTGEMARYSNVADNPAVAGFLAFGGDINFSEADSAEGIMSLYTSPTYPGSDENTSGWASWAGTSFACAVACGTLARLYNFGMDAPSAEQLLKDVSLEDQVTSAHYIPVAQGKP